LKHIDEVKINSLINIKSSEKEIDEILEKTKSLKRLSIVDSAKLMTVSNAKDLKKIYDAAAFVKNEIYGKRVVLFVPLYISNLCFNSCLYCGFSVQNNLIERKKLTIAEIISQTEFLLKKGHKRILLVSGEMQSSKENINYYVEAINAVYSAQINGNKIKRVNINVAPMDVESFKKLKFAGIGTYQIFQETYHDETYRKLHISGTKADPDNRLDAIDNAFKAGIDDVGIGPLLGLYDYRFEILALLMHIEYLETTYSIGPHTISVPRIEPALGSKYTENIQHAVSDEDFKKIVAVLRLSVPYTGIILSTRENSHIRDELLDLGVSQISAASSVTPGGYNDNSLKHNDSKKSQFALSDMRSLEEITASLISKNYIPSFCAACYRRNRTGENFMNLAKPGDIKPFCELNALLTLKEYLLDFASPKTKELGYELINKCKKNLNKPDITSLEKFFENIDKGIRDEYV
jgi:2-iminoacetate synthase